MKFSPENKFEKERALTPPVKEGFVRLYRGETYDPETVPAPEWLLDQAEIKNRPKGSFFTDSYEEAVWYNENFGIKDGNITYVDIREEDLEQYRASNNRGKEFSSRGLAEKEFFLPEEIAALKSKFFKD